MNYVLWQLIDSGFPSGGFAHSSGLEASLHHGRIADGAGVQTFARQALSQAGRGALPIVTAAFQDPGTLAELNRVSDVFLSNPVANRASRAQGRALLTSVSRSFPQTRLAGIEESLSKGPCAHYAPVFGAVFHALDVNLTETQRAFLFISVRGVSSAAVRLGLIGAYEAQSMQTDLASSIDRTIERCGSLAPAEIAQTAPLLDLCQSTHDRLYSRLFQS
jgi:urease accessory protein